MNIVFDSYYPRNDMPVCLTHDLPDSFELYVLSEEVRLESQLWFVSSRLHVSLLKDARQAAPKKKSEHTAGV
jgi:hypothetical protein